MKHIERFQRGDGFDGRYAPGARDDDTVGPQGKALILELRRLQVALDRESHDRPRRFPNGGDLGDRRAGTADARRSSKPRRKRKSVVGRAIDICLENLGLRERRRADTSASSADAAPPTSPTSSWTRRDRDEEASYAQKLHRNERTAAQATRRIRPLPPLIDGSQTFQIEPPGVRPDVRHHQHAALATTSAYGELANRAVGTGMKRLKHLFDFVVGRAPGIAIEDKPGTELVVRVGRAFEGELRTGLRVLIVSAGVMGGWAMFVPLSGAVVVPGALVVESKVKKVQHPTGGVVAQILVNDGAHVSTGDPVVRLDETQARANQQMLTKQLDQIRMRIARLVSERDGADEVNTPRELAARADNDGIKQLLMSERTLFSARTTARRSQKELLQTHVSQLNEQIVGFEAQIKSKADQLGVISGELEGVQSLYQKGLVALPRLTTLQREVSRLDGERGQLVSAIAEARSKISEAEIQILRIDQDFRTELMKDLREAQDKEAELTEKTVAAQDLLNRTDIRAPTTGIVNQLSVHTIGGVVAPGEVIMEIVPDSDALEIEARLQPQDIDQVRPGQTTYVRFSAFNQRTTPQLIGRVSYISADLSHDRQTNAAYYTVRVTLPGDERRRLGDLQLISGMPAEVFLQTGSRTMMSYLLKPMSDQFHHMFNER
jgi:membrane fusion protein, type I secretion system